MKRSMFIIAALTALVSTNAIAGDIEIHNKDDVTIVQGSGFEAIAEIDQLSWCYETDRETICGGTETKWGCQYFPEEGPADDISVCILTTLAENCCECLSVCPDEGDEEEGRGFDPALLIEVIVDATEPTEDLPAICRWVGTPDSCKYYCGVGNKKALCHQHSETGDQWCTTGSPDEAKNYGQGPSPCA